MSGDFRGSLFSSMPLPCLGWVGLNRAWASHRECARRVPVAAAVQINHSPSILSFILLHTFARIFKGRLKAAVCEGGISSKKRAAAPTGAHGGTSRPVRLIKISITTPGRNVRFIAVVKTERMSIYLIIYLFILIVLGVISFTHQPVRIAPPSSPPSSLYM